MGLLKINNAGLNNKQDSALSCSDEQSDDGPNRNKIFQSLNQNKPLIFQLKKQLEINDCFKRANVLVRRRKWRNRFAV